MLKYKQIWHGIKPIKWLIKFNLTKLYRLATKKFSDVELKREEISTKFNEANQTIGALRFENNFLVEKIKKVEAELFQVRA